MAWFKKMVVVAALLPSTLAVAGEWDWNDEFQSRHWRNATLEWAQEIHPSHPSITTLKASTPPAHEMWCHVPDSQPTAEDFAIHQARLDTWLHNFLNVPAQDPLPPTPPFPNECVR